jgi:serine/threonine protein phosphatase 1
MSTPRSFVIGDVHGCLEELNRLLDALAPTADDTVCFLGDYVDRGPSARGVIERLLRLRQEGPRCVFLKGNHEDMFLSFLGLTGRYGEVFLANGGNTTLASYGLEGLSPPEVARRLPPSHHEFLQSLQTEARFGRFLCVHAGVRPSRALDRQSEEDLLWIREDFIAHPHPFPVTVLFGHTPRKDVTLDLPFKIGLDTGLVYGNRLSCLELVGARLSQIARGSTQVTTRSLSSQLAAAGLGPA